MSSPGETLVPIEVYKKAGTVFGTQICTKHMKKFTYKILPDGYYLLDVAKIDERLRIASRYLASFDPDRVAVVAVRLYAQTPARKMCEYVGCAALTGRIIPGVFTNPKLESYMEPDVVLVSDPRSDKQALDEASKVGIPIVAFADTDNRVDYVDLVIPANNKGRRSLALLFWIMAREILRNRGVLGRDESLPETYEDFLASKVR